MVEAKFVPFDQNKDVIMEIRTSAFDDNNELDALDNEVDTKHVIIYVGCSKPQPVATGRLCKDKNETIIDKVAVMKEEQRKKYGELSVRMLVDKAFRNGTDEVFAYANEKTIVFFQKIGFQKYSTLSNGILKLVINKIEFYGKKCNII